MAFVQALTILGLVFQSSGALLSSSHTQQPVRSGVNGGTSCAVCTIVVGLVEQVAEIDDVNATKALAKICDLLPKNISSECTKLIDLFGPEVISWLDARETPDVVCKALKVCNGSCSLFPPPKDGFDAALQRLNKQHSMLAMMAPPDICNWPIIARICKAINNFGNMHEPLDDIDGDGFSPLHTLRGADWRGKDCDDSDVNIRPGRKPLDSDVNVDSNCNGIYGVDPTTNTPYEELFCKDTQQYGVVVLGDSASAHFHVQPQYLNTTAWHKGVFDRVLFSLENEFDWPMMSASTAFAGENDFAPDIEGPNNSTYKVMRQRNRCMHRDFQNIAVNGARAGPMNTTIVKSMARNPTEDQPVLAVYALIGNDVCNGHEDTIAHMTTPEQMRAAAQGTLLQLEQRLPKGSHVFMMGLADGSILYDTMADRIHPIGALHKDVKTKDVYAFLNCLSISPCRGWMNKNETLRNATTAHANLLSSVLESVAASFNSSVITTHYFPNPFAPAIQQWVANGGQAWQLIEPVDGFHPSQLAQPLVTELFWKYLEDNHSDLLPPINPHNDAIAKMFGDQGGY
eukprot:TRINITY_DN2975_c0_g1_i1.p1 TRINITY_DN2975_c0_g1~~TRINITY_DN2975_c0_g1_i1.p1  ORF type:complete len:580 (+),score=155.55 TRINITY_DN2975_c0_g1_i1:31-1740(+)